MTYEETLSYLYSRLPMFQRIGAAAYKSDLTNTVNMLTQLGDPQNRLRCVHIAGTNGKGSVAAMLASIMQDSGLRTGLYTSPHLTDFRERIRINGEMISKEKVMDFVQQHKSLFDEMDLSFFEWTVGLAFHFFKSEKVDIAVIETGMGGRLDSTNLVTPDVSVITNIGMDHTQFLGDTISKIAAEKAGIIKRGVPLIIGRHQAEADNIFANKASELNCRIVFASDHYEARNNGTDPHNGMNVTILKDGNVLIKDLPTELAGDYQLENICTAVAVAEELVLQGWEIVSANIADGIRKVRTNTGFSGRWHKVDTNPTVICDVAHNSDGIRHVIRQLEKTPKNKLIAVLGMSSDKDHEEILSLFPENGLYHFARTSVPRSADPAVLKAIATAQGKRSESHDSIKQALKAAYDQAEADDLIFIGGSFFAVADALAVLKGPGI